jgi:hypothetical protein
VSGRLINGFSSHDLILALMYRCVCSPSTCTAKIMLYVAFDIACLCVAFTDCDRYEKWAVHVAGVANVSVPGVENVDFGYIVKKVQSF